MSMTPRDMVVLTGQALTGGEDWAKPLARALGAYHPDGPRDSIDPRSVSRWRTGAMEVLPWAVEALPVILREHAADQLIPNPVDPLGMADLGFAQTPRGLADTVPASIKRRPYQASYESPTLPTEGSMPASARRPV